MGEGVVMEWMRVPLRLIAPARSSSVRFKPDEPVWQLTLDQIEADTGNIVDKKVALASEAGTSTHYFDSGNVLYSKLRPYLNKAHNVEACSATPRKVPKLYRGKLSAVGYAIHKACSAPTHKKRQEADVDKETQRFVFLPCRQLPARAIHPSAQEFQELSQRPQVKSFNLREIQRDSARRVQQTTSLDSYPLW